MNDEVFFLEKMRARALLELEERVAKHLKNEFYNKILPKIIKDVKKDLIIELYQESDSFNLMIKIKDGKNE